MRLPRRAAWLGASFALLADCSPFEAGDSGAAGAPSADAGLGQPEGAAAPIAINLDGGDQVDAGPPRVSPCADAHLFCADFDDGKVPTGWTPQWETAGPPTVLARPDLGGVLVAALAAELKGDRSRIRRPLPVGGASITFDAKVGAIAWPTDESVGRRNIKLVNLELITSTSVKINVAVYISQGPNRSLKLMLTSFNQSSGATANLGTFPELRFDTWLHLALRFQPGQSPTFTLDGNDPSEPGAADVPPLNGATLELGLERPNDATPAVRAEYDFVHADEL